MIFISPVRICVHNIPVKLLDKHLKAICMKAAAQGKAARVVEVGAEWGLHRGVVVFHKDLKLVVLQAGIV